MAPGNPNFTYTPNCSGLIQFTNTSTANYSPINYLWTFPDGTTSTLQNPTFTFQEGIYPVTLQVSSPEGCSRDTTINVLIYPSPDPNFIAPPVCLGGITQFTNLTPNIPNYNLTYLWNFGDNGSSIQISPSHLYLSDGTYTVTLTATTNSSPPCSSTINGQVIVHPLPNQPSNIQFN